MERCLAEQKSRFQNDLQDSLRDEDFRALLKQELWNREYDGDDDYEAEAGEPPRKSLDLGDLPKSEIPSWK